MDLRIPQPLPSHRRHSMLRRALRSTVCWQQRTEWRDRVLRCPGGARRRAGGGRHRSHRQWYPRRCSCCCCHRGQTVTSKATLSVKQYSKFKITKTDERNRNNSRRHILRTLPRANFLLTAKYGSETEYKNTSTFTVGGGKLIRFNARFI